MGKNMQLSISSVYEAKQVSGGLARWVELIHSDDLYLFEKTIQHSTFKIKKRKSQS